MSAPSYWLSASVLTITSAPSFSPASSPAWKPAARPLLFVSRTMWSTPCCARDLDRAVGRAVVDDQPLDRVEAGDLAREVGERQRQLLLLVETGDLDDELHGAVTANALPAGRRRVGGCRREPRLRRGVLPSHGSGILVPNMDTATRQQRAAPAPWRSAMLASAPSRPPVAALGAARPTRTRPARPAPPRARGCCSRSRFLLRLWGIKQGLPYSYNVDEATHFVPRAIGVLRPRPEPALLPQPARLLVPAAPRVRAVVRRRGRGAARLRDRSDRGLRRRPRRRARSSARSPCGSPTWPARASSTARVGLLAAAIFGVAFLPVFYSHLALNDVPDARPGRARRCTAPPRVLRRGAPARLRDRRHRRSGSPRPRSTPAAITLLLPAGGVRLRRAPAARRWSLRGGSLLAARAARCSRSSSPTRTRCSTSRRSTPASRRRRRWPAAGPVKLGTTAGSGIAYYLWTFTWGLGWVPALAAIGGAVAAARARAGSRWRWCCCRRRSPSSSSWATSSASSGAG